MVRGLVGSDSRLILCRPSRGNPGTGPEVETCQPPTCSSGELWSLWGLQKASRVGRGQLPDNVLRACCFLYTQCPWTLLLFALWKGWLAPPWTMEPKRRHAGFFVSLKSPFQRKSVRNIIVAPSRTIWQGQPCDRVLHWRQQRKIRIFDFKPPGDFH